MRRRLLCCLLLGSCQSGPSPASRFVNTLGMEMIRIPPGEFLMGSSPEEAARIANLMKEKKITSWYPDSPKSESPPRLTRLTRAYYLSSRETTLGQFARFARESGYRTDAERDGRGADGKKQGKWVTSAEFNWREMGFERSEDYPVLNVSWNDAVAFCLWLSKNEGRPYHLPTEAQWEYACRAGSTGRYPWGDDDSRRNDYAWTGANAGGGPHPTGTLKPNAWDLYDMLGNAYEYCSDYFQVQPYDAAQAVDPVGPREGTERVVRGGSWGTDPMHPRSAFRGGAAPDHRNRRDGFRVACDVD